MRHFAIFLLFFVTFIYSANASEEAVSYSNNLLQVLDKINNVGADNKVLKEKIDVQQKYFETTLSEQKKQYETELNMQQKHYEAALNHLTTLYSIVIGALAVIGFVLNWFGWDKLKTFIQSYVSKEHNNAIDEVTKKLSSDPELQRRIEALVKIEIEKHGGENFEGGVE